MLERLGLVTIPVAAFRPHVRISKRTQKEWTRGRRWRGLLDFHGEMMWNGRLPASTELFVTVLRQAEQRCETTIFDSTWTFREAYRLATHRTQSRSRSVKGIWICHSDQGQWGQRNLKSKKSPAGEPRIEQLYRIFPWLFPCSSRLFQKTPAYWIDLVCFFWRVAFFWAVRFLVACGVLMAAGSRWFEAHLKRLKSMVRIHRAQYKRVQVGWKSGETSQWSRTTCCLLLSQPWNMMISYHVMS